MKFHGIRGMRDILPGHSCLWQWVEKNITSVLNSYSYQELRLPLLENIELFSRGIGLGTDVVSKEMYTLLDRNDEKLALRPEATAGCVRAGIEHGLLYNQVQRFWTQGSMFRYERPQKGRYRQFNQFSIETFGMSEPYIEAELMLLNQKIWQKLGVDQKVSLQINTIGEVADRARYREALVTFLKKNVTLLDEDSYQRLHTNPLRILDSKNPTTQALLQDGPVLSDFIGDDSKKHFDDLLLMLDHFGIAYQENPRLVRGLDYYNRTVFEWVTDALGAQGTICAGGRYDYLVELLGGKNTPAVGCAIGLDRLLLLVESSQNNIQTDNPDIFLLSNNEKSKYELIQLSEQLRNYFPNLIIWTELYSGNIKSAFKRAERKQASIVLTLEDSDWTKPCLNLKVLSTGVVHAKLTSCKVIEYIDQYVKGRSNS